MNNEMTVTVQTPSTQGSTANKLPSGSKQKKSGAGVAVPALQVTSFAYLTDIMEDTETLDIAMKYAVEMHADAMAALAKAEEEAKLKNSTD
jgi:hypothetical protein